MPNPVYAILSSDGRTANAYGRFGKGNGPATALRDLAAQLLKLGLNSDVPLRVCSSDYRILATIPSLADAMKPFGRHLARQIAPQSRSMPSWLLAA